MEQPDYYKKNGLSPIDAFKKGLISEEQYKGFLIGNIIKYTIRAGSKDDAIKDLNKAKHYLDFYIELFQQKQQDIDPAITVNIDTDKVDMDKIKETITEEVKNALISNYPELVRKQ